MREFLILKRTEKKMSQKDVADRVEISQPAYCDIEHGKKNPSVRTAQKIAKVLGFKWTLFFE